MIFTHEITLDITFNEIKIINIKQYTKDSFLLHVNLTDRGEPFCADKNNLICQFKMKTPDGKCIFTDGIINDDGSVDISIPEKACLTAGSGTAEIIFVTSEIVAKANSADAGTNELLDGSATDSIGDSIASYGTHSQDGAVFATMNLNVNIVASSYNNDYITSSDDFDALHSALLAANKTYDRVMTSANSSADAARQHEANAATYADAANTSANAANTSANAANTSANAARDSALLSKSYAVGGTGLTERNNENEDCAKHYCEEAGKESQKSSDSALLSKSYAVGGTGIRENEDMENARNYYEQCAHISEGLKGGLMPMGTIASTNLPALETTNIGWMYNISDEFITNSNFHEGPGLTIPAGSNIYKTADGKWDVLAGSPVTGVKGHSETNYRKGNVNITKANIGLGNVDNTADADKSVKYATSAGNAIKATQDGDGNVIKNSYAVKNTITNGDLNNITLPGLYMIQRCSNTPEKDMHYALLVLNSSTDNGGTHITQLAFKDTTNNIYIRTGRDYSNYWTSWKRLYIEGDTVTKAEQDSSGNKITDTYLPLSGGTVTGNLRLKGSGNYGNVLNFGDGDYVHISEPTDDCLEIKAKKLNLVISDTSNTNFTINEKRILREGDTIDANTVGGKSASELQNYNNLTNKPTIPKIQYGVATHTVTTNNPETFNVTFDKAFSSAPVVVCTPRHNSEVTIASFHIARKSTTGFTGLIKYTGSSALTFSFEWIAIGS